MKVHSREDPPQGKHRHPLDLLLHQEEVYLVAETIADHQAGRAASPLADMDRISHWTVPMRAHLAVSQQDGLPLHHLQLNES